MEIINMSHIHFISDNTIHSCVDPDFFKTPEGRHLTASEVVIKLLSPHITDEEAKALRALTEKCKNLTADQWKHFQETGNTEGIFNSHTWLQVTEALSRCGLEKIKQFSAPNNAANAAKFEIIDSGIKFFQENVLNTISQPYVKFMLSLERRQVFPLTLMRAFEGSAVFSKLQHNPLNEREETSSIDAQEEALPYLETEAPPVSIDDQMEILPCLEPEAPPVAVEEKEVEPEAPQEHPLTKFIVQDGVPLSFSGVITKMLASTSEEDHALIEQAFQQAMECSEEQWTQFLEVGRLPDNMDSKTWVTLLHLFQKKEYRGDLLEMVHIIENKKESPPQSLDEIMIHIGNGIIQGVCDAFLKIAMTFQRRSLTPFQIGTHIKEEDERIEEKFKTAASKAEEIFKNLSPEETAILADLFAKRANAQASNAAEQEG